MKRPAIPIAATVLVVAILGLLVYGITSRGTDTTLDDAVKSGQTPTAPGATLKRPNLDGTGATTLASLRGKIVVLNFWATWCVPCQDEAPVLQRAQQDLAKRGDGTVLGATYNDVASDSRGFIRTHHLTYPNVRDVGTDLARAYGTVALPETFVINARGKIVGMSRGQLNDRFLTEAIAKARASA